MNVKLSATRFLFLISKISKRIWVRSFLYALVGIATAFVALFVRDLVPDEISNLIGVSAVGNILTILASSMLTVATFSLAIMVASYGNISSNATPRATKLLIENQSAQRTVATFIGAFLYSIVGIVALATNVYGGDGRLILFLVTIVVIIVIVATIIKWVDQLSTVGQVGNTISEIERVTLLAIKERISEPYLGGQRLEADPFSSDAQQIVITSEKVGFVVLIDMKAIQKICEDYDITISLAILPGSFIYPDRPLATVNTSVDLECLKGIASHFEIENIRTFDQDPRFGFVLLSEIASRALSAGINDPGTALEVINSATRLLKMRTDLIREAGDRQNEVRYSRVFVPSLQGSELIASVFAPIARDGATMFEIGVRIQETLKSLKLYDPEYQIGCDLYAEFNKQHSSLTMKTQFEKDLVTNAWNENGIC